MALLLAVACASPDPASAQDAVSFASNDADLTGGTPTQLKGILFRPAGPGPFAAVVMMHGCGGAYGKDGALRPNHRWWAETFVAAGYVALAVDSFSPRGLGAVCGLTTRPIQTDRERARDAYGALAYLQSRSEIRADRIALAGWSHGGGSTLAAVGSTTPARPARLPYGDFRAAVAFYPGCGKASRDRDWVPVLPLLVLTGALDDWTRAEPCRQVERRLARTGNAAGFTLVVYPGAYHGFDAEAMPVHTRTGVSSTRSGTATLGTNPAARADAIPRVLALFAERLR